jgi:hypothetical protein
VSGALAFLVAHYVEDNDEVFDSPGEAAAVGGGVGFGLGAIVGAIAPTERWRGVQLAN